MSKDADAVTAGSKPTAFVEQLMQRGLGSGGLVLLGSIGAALLVGAILILWAGENPFNVYWVIFRESLLEGSGWRDTLVQATPLGIIGLGLAFGCGNAWRCHLGRHLGLAACQVRRQCGNRHSADGLRCGTTS